MMTSATFHPQDFEFDISSKDELTNFFRLRDRPRVILRNDLEFPMRVRYYFTWSDSSGAYRYLVLKKPGWENPKGMIFRNVGSNAEGVGTICDWCHAYGNSSQIGLLTTKISATRTVGMMLCLDLSCGDKIENGPSQSNKDPETRIVQVCQKMATFFEEML